LGRWSIGFPAAGGGIGLKIPSPSFAHARSVWLSDHKMTGAERAGQRKMARVEAARRLAGSSLFNSSSALIPL
jgi:hypothetical protein